jgi:hypothetical protein
VENTSVDSLDDVWSHDREARRLAQEMIVL